MEDERSKKLAAGRDRLAKFQKKKKKKKKEPKSDTFKANGDTSIVNTSTSFLEETPDGGDSVDEFSAGSSDLLGSNSDILSSLSEIDQRSIGTDDLCQDSDTSQLDAEVARVELAEARTRIHQLEESLLGKQTALDLLQNELSQMRSSLNNNTDNSDSSSQNINKNEATTINSSGQEAELRAALEQYNIKIQEFQQALSQRDQVIQQLTANVQTVIQSRDAVQAEATAQTNQLSQYIQTLQDQLQQTGEALRNQSGEQMSSLADELNMAQSQVTALQQNVADKDAIMQQLAERYAQKAQELIELSEDREELRRKSFGEIAALQEKLKDVSGDLTPREKEDSLLKLQAELDESYGSQIVMMKQQLEEKHKEELGLWKQRYDEMERIAAASSDSNLMRTELEDQLKEAKAKLGEKDAEIMKYKGDIDNLSLKLANLNNAHEKQLEELDAAHKNEIEFVREQAQKRWEEYVNELKAELSSTQDELNTSLNDLEEEKKKVQEAEDVIAEKALNSSSLQDNLTKEIGILAGELQRKDEEIQDLSKVRMTLQDQLKKLTSDQKENVAQLQSQINDLFTENSQLQKDLERLNKEKVTLEEAALDEGAIRSEIEEELKSQYEDQIDELNFAHETLLQQVRNDLICEHQVALKKVEKDYETKFQQKLENVSVSKQHEFVAELQKVQVELKAKYDREIEEKLAEERAKWSGVSSGPQSSGDQEGGPEVHRLQAEVQELSEARDALLTQVDSTTHENEALQEELLQVISEKDTLVEMASSPPEMACFSSPVEEDQMRKELEMLRDCLGKSESTKKDLEEKMSEMEDSYKVRLAEIESEKQALAEQMEEMIPQMEMIKEANKMQENLDSMTKHRNQLLTDKEELQHLLETQEKEHEGKMLELLMEKEAACSDIEKLKASLEEEKERVTSDPSAEIGELTETLSELVRLQEKASKVEVLEAEVQSLSCKLQSLEEHVSEEAGSDSDKLEELQDQLQSHQRLVTDLTDSLKAAENELELLRGSSSELAKCDTEIDALQKELESLQRENKGYLEAKENLARDLDEKEQELESFQKEKTENLEAKENLARDLDEKEKELENLQREIREHFEAKENLARDLDETKKELENVQRVNKEYLEAKENLASDLDEMRSKLESLQRENREYFEVKENLARDLDEKEQELENLQRENRKYFAAKENLARDLEEKKQKLVSLNDEMNRLDSDNKTLSDQLSGKEELQKTVETLRSEKVLLQGSITHFNEEVERLKRDLNKKEEEVSCERERYSSLENELEMLKDVGKGAYEPTQKDEEKREDVVKLEEDGGEGGEADEGRSGEVEEGVEGEQVNDQGEVQDEYESQMSSLQAKGEEEQNISKEMRAAVEEKEKEVDCLKNDLAEKVGEIEDLQCKLSEMKEINSKGEQREHNLQNAIKILERDLGIQREEYEGLQKEVEVLKNDIENGGKNLAIIQSERDDLLEKVKGLEQNLKEQKGEASILEENVSQLEKEKSSLLERNAILEQEFESEKANIDALIKATLDESEKGEHVGGEVLDGDGEVGEEQTGEARKKGDEIVGSSQESESKLAEISEDDNRVKHLQDEIEDLRERLQYVDRESVREKKEYDKRLMQTEAELMKSQGLRAVLEAQIKAQKNMFDEEMGRLQNELSSLLGEKEELKDTLGSLKEVVELVPLVQEEVLVAEQVSGEASSLLNLKEELTSNDVDQEFEKLWQEVGKLKEESKAKEEEISKLEQETDLVLTERDSALQQQEEARIQLENLREVLEESQKENLNLKSELASIKKKLEEACVAKESPVKEEESVENISFNQKENEAGHPSGDDDSLEQGETAEVDVTPSREEELKAKLDTFKEVLEETQKENLELKSELASVKELLAEGNVAKQVLDNENLETRSVEPKESDVSTQTENEAGTEQQLSVDSVGGPEEEKVLIENLREALEEIQKENLELKSELVSVKDLLAEGNVAKQVPDNENLETRSVEPKESDVGTQTENEAGAEQQLSVDSVERPEEEKVLIENLREALEEIQKENLELKSELASVKDLLAEGNVAKQVPDNENLETRSVKPKESDVSSLLVNEAGTEQQVSDDSVGGPEEQKVLIKKMREALEETQRENVGLKTELTVIREELENANTGRKILSEEKGISDERSEGEMDNKSLPEAEEEGALMTEIQGLKDELEETKEIYSKEKNLLQEALEDEKNQVASEQVPGGGKSGSAEVVRLNRMIKEKEQHEKEILTEKNLQISVLQEASVRLEEEKEELLRQLKDLEELSSTPTAESKEFSSPSVMNEGADYVDANLAGRLDASIAREEMLKKEKDMLLEKIAEQEEIHRRLAAEKEELQRQLCDKQRLEELLLEKDRLEQELARQKKSMESELHDIEGQLRQRENHLMREKSQLENELKQKDLLLRRWEVGYREHQLKLRNQEMLLEKQYSEQLSKVQHEFEEGRVSHLEKLRSEIEKRHAEAIARLRRDLHQEFALRESRLNESHLSDISLLKSQHNSQLKELLEEFEAKNESLRKELEAEKQKHPESSNQIDIQELQERHKKELESLKATAEAVYTSQLDDQLARCERDKAKALVAQLEELQEQHNQEMEKMKEDFEESLMEKEEKFQAEISEKLDVKALTSNELIGLLQQKLSSEHEEVIQDLTEQLDQTALEYLEALRAKMEVKHKEELNLERSEGQQQTEFDLESLKREWAEEHKLDIEALVTERERVVSQAEEMKVKLETVHKEELAQLRAKMQADFDQLAKAREDLEKTKSQTEQSLKEELEGLRYAFEDLQQKYADEKESAARNLDLNDSDAAGLIQQLEKEVEELQKELTNQRNKLQQEHAEELAKLKAYFEQELADTEEKWAKELEKVDTKADNTSLGSSLEEQELATAKRPDFSHSLMTLTHISDTESSPPRSPVKNKDMEAEFRQQMRGDLEQEYKKSLENLRNELENEHKAETAGIKLEYELKHEQDLEREKEALRRKHEHELSVQEMKHLEALDNLRKELDDDHAEEISRVRTEAMEEAARKIDEEREKAMRDFDQQLSERLEETKSELNEKYQTELMEKLGEEQSLRDIMEEKHIEEMEKLQSEFAKEKAALQEKAQEDVSAGVAQVLVDSSISYAEETETQREELLKKNDLIAILKQELAQTEARTQQLSREIDKRNSEEALNQTQQLQEKNSSEIAQLQAQLEEEQARFKKLKEDVQSGEAPEVQAMREGLVQQYDSQLEMIKTTMNEELETLTRMTQQQSAKDLEEMQAKFVAEHEQMLERFAEDQERIVEEVRLQQEMDMENMKKQLTWQHEEDKNKALEELEQMMEDAKAKEIEALVEKQTQELKELTEQKEREQEKLKNEFDEKWKKQKAQMDKELEDQLNKFGDAESLLQQLRENHEQEKERLKDELTSTHMEKFKEVTDKLEEEHQRQLEEMRDETKQVVEEEAAEKLKVVEEALEAEKVAKNELEESHKEEIAKMKDNYQEEVKRLLDEYEDKIKAVTLDSEKELEVAKLELEEAHRKEVIDLQEKLNTEKKQEVDELNNHLMEVTDLMKLEHQQELEQIGNDHQKEMEDLIREKEKCVEELQQELAKLQEEKERMQQEHLVDTSEEKGSIDTILRECDEKWQKELQAKEDQHQQVLQKLLDEINEVQEEKAALVKRGLEKDTVLARRERENEEANNLISMLRSDLDRIGSERENLQQVNNHLLQVLSQAVRASIATEEAISKRLTQDRRPEGAAGGDGVDSPPPNTSFQSSYSDEGLDLSQQLAESMFAGPDLDADGEELITNANARLQTSVETLLQRMTGTFEAEERVHASQTEQLQTGPSNNEENQRLRADVDTLQERLKEESQERQILALELDRHQGLLQGMQTQKDELQDALKNAEEKQLQVIVDLERAKSEKRAAEDECLLLRQQHEQLIGQLEGKERDLADEISRLNKENGALKNEMDDLLQQAKKDRENFKSQVQLLESSVEEQMAKWEKILEEKNSELDDLQDQQEAADKQLKANKQFLEQQSAEREQEREEFQKEIQRLEGLSGKGRTNNYEEEDIRKELHDTKEELKSLKEDYTETLDQKQELEKEVLLKDETVWELTSQIKELERTVDEIRAKSEPLESQIETMEKELMALRKLEEELTHEKEALFKQCSDQLLQISALHSKLDANKQGMEEEGPRPMMDDEEDVGKSLASVALMQQLEQEREALERKEKEIKALEEQLDQFRDGLVSKEDEISQLNLQLDIANKTAPEERQAKEKLIAENEHLQEQLAALQEKISTLIPQSKSLDSLTQDLLEEKNQQIDELTSQVMQTQEELEAVKQQMEGLRDRDEDEKEDLKEELEEKLMLKDAEIASLQEEIADAENRDNIAESLVVETLERVRSKQEDFSKDQKIQLEEELRTTKQLLAVREREIAQLEAQLMSLQGSPGRSKNIQEETVDKMQKEMEDKDLQLMQLKIQVDQAEETVFQAQQQLGQLSTLPREHQQLQQELHHLKEKHSKEMKELKKRHKDALETREAEHKTEIEGLLAAQEEDWKKIQQLEKDYEGKISLLGKLSPGKSLQQKLDEIKDELTKQHQEHVADIQRTMSREADERIEQLKAQFAQESLLLQQRHQHELEEAILRTNRDLMAAHAEEVAKLREDHRIEVDRIMAASPASMSQFTDMNQMIQNELGLAQMRGRPSGISQEIPSQADSGVSSGDISTEGLSEKLKLILNRIKGEGLSLLSLSELRYLHDQTVPKTPLQKGLDVGTLQEAWENEKRALLDAIQSLKDLVTQMSSSQRSDLDQDGDDWRGELLHTIQLVFQCERDALKAELSTNVAMSGDQNITEIQLLQRRIREQENFHKSAVEQIYGADRTSILGESRDLFSQNQALKEELQKSRQRLTQQLKALEDQSNKRERQLKRQLETIEHKFRQERILVEDLRTSLTVEKEKGEQLSESLQKAKGQVEEQQEEISDLLSKIDKQTGDREAMESRLADVTAAFEAERSQNRTLNSTLAEEKKAARSLHEALDAESRRVNHARNREQQMIKELHRELQQQKNRNAEVQKNMEKEALRSNALTRELESIRAETVSEVQHEKAKFTELKTGLELERSRCQELKTALQREQVLNAQLQSTLEKERQENADMSLQEKTAIAELQAKLDSSQAEVVDLSGQIKQLENAIHRMESVLETERAQNKEAVSRERAAGRQMKSSVDSLESKLEEVQSHLLNEQERSARLKGEKERLQQSLENQMTEDKDALAQRERERENEKKKQLEREREREVERQRQRDQELEHQLDQQKIRSLEEQVEDWKNHAQQTLEELQRVQDKKKYENEEDAEMQRELETELQKSLERHSPAGREASSADQRSRFSLLREQLEAIRQRLQLIAVKEHEGLVLMKRMNQTVSETTLNTSHELHSLERTLQEATAELKQIHGAIVLQTEVSTGVPASKSRLNTRLLNQNAELSNYISKLSDEKSELRRQVSQLEEQLWTVKQRQLHKSSSPPRGTRRDLDLLFAEERNSWERERISTQNALRQAEREIIRLKLELEHNASNRESDVELLLSNGDIPEHQQHKFQRLYGKYLRAESFRKSLIYQKKYLLLLLGGFQDTEEASLALIAKMGGYPNPANMDEGSRHSKAFTKFRSAVRVCIAIQRLKYLKRKWQRACGTTNHSSPPSSLSQPPLLSLQRSLPSVYHSSTAGAPAPTFLSPARHGSRIGIASSGSPPVRDRVVSGGTNGLVNGADGYSSPHAPYRSNSHSRFRDRLSMSPHDSSEDPDVSLTRYIKKLENLQEKIGTGSWKGEQNGSRRQLPNQRR